MSLYVKYPASAAGSSTAITSLVGDVTASGPGVATATISNGVITNAMVAAAAAIDYSKLAVLSGNRVLVSNALGVLVTSSTSLSEIAYVEGVTSPIQTQLNAKQATGNYITSLTGDVTAAGPGAAAATVAFVGAYSAANVAAGATLANAATSANTLSAIVRRDASGNFTAGTITASLTGNVTGNASGTAASITGNLTGNVTSVGMSTTIAADVVTNAMIATAAGIVDTKLATIATAGKVSNSATTAASINTVSAIVARDSSGNFSAGTITAALTGNVSGNVSGTAASITGNLTGDVTSVGMATTIPAGTITNAMVSASAAIVDTKLATIATAGKVSNSATTATSANTLSAIVARDGSGNFSAGTITASLSGNATTATSAGNVSGTVAIANGGTGQTAKTAAFDALSPMTTFGDIIVGGAAGTNARVAAGSASQVLQIQGGVPTWATVNLSGINYISSNPSAETDTTGWATYSNAASNRPTTGVTGTATGLTFSRSTGSPLRGAASFSIVQTNSTSLQGKGVSYDFTIDSADKAKMLSVNFDFNASSTFIASNGTTAPLMDGTTSTNAGNSDIEVFIYDVTNAALIPVMPAVITANGTNNFSFSGEFQTASNSTSYRLILHCATASANAAGYTFKYDNVSVGPQSKLLGPPITDSVAYTPTFSAGFGTPSAISITQTRMGGYLYIAGKFTTGASPNAGTQCNLSLPSGLSIDFSKIGTVQVVGQFNRNAGAVGYSVIADSSTPTVIYVGANSNGFTYLTGAGIGASEMETFTALVPIAGWSSTTTMSNDSDTRVVAGEYTTAVATSIAAATDTLIPFGTVVKDTHSAYNTGTSLYSAPVSGWYQVEANLETGIPTWAVGNQFNVILYINGVAGARLATTVAQAAAAYRLAASGSRKVYLNAGDTLGIYARSSVATALEGTAVNNWFTLSRLSGPATIAASESVNCRYSTALAQDIPNATYTILNYGTKDYDTHNAVTTGTSWKFTAPIAGKYHIDCAALFGVAIADKELNLYKNGAMFVGSYNGATVRDVQGHWTIALLAGDYIDIRVYQGNGGSRTLTGNAVLNWVNIERVGN